MFSNHTLHSLCTSSDERLLKLSKADWDKVLHANRIYSEDIREWRGSQAWGDYLLNKIGFKKDIFWVNPSLELCCGNGFLYFSLGEYLKASSCNAFIDLSIEQCKAFKDRCSQSGSPYSTVLCGDVGQLPFKSNALKIVYGNSFLHHLPDVGVYLREIYRVLSPGGKFLDFHEPTSTAILLERFPISLVMRKGKLQALSDIWLINPDIITQLLNEAGFSTIKIFPNRFLSCIVIEPLFKSMARIIRNVNRYPDLEAKCRVVCDHAEKIFSDMFLRSFAPSIAIYAEKPNK